MTVATDTNKLVRVNLHLPIAFAAQLDPRYSYYGGAKSARSILAGKASPLNITREDLDTPVVSCSISIPEPLHTDYYGTISRLVDDRHIVNTIVLKEHLDVRYRDITMIDPDIPAYDTPDGVYTVTSVSPKSPNQLLSTYQMISIHKVAHYIVQITK